MSGRPDLVSLIAGFGSIAVGALLFADSEGQLSLTGEWLAPLLIALAGLVLLASGLGARNR